MKITIILLLALASFNSFARSIEPINRYIKVEFSCVIEGHGGGCSVETYSLEGPKEAKSVKVFTSFIEGGKLYTFETETSNTNSIKVITSRNGSYNSNTSLRIGLDTTVVNLIFIGEEGRVIESQKEVIRSSFVEEY